MADPLGDLMPLFLGEAGERLERLAGLLESVDDERAAAARRELHALKGASRMMGLAEVSELCHHAEELLLAPTPDRVAETVAVVDRVLDLVTALAEGVPPATAGLGPDDGPDVADPPSPGGSAGEVRIATAVLDDLADRAARLRVLAVAAGGLVERVHQLARLAETGIGERAPEQVLATVATSLRQLALDFESGQRSLRRLADRQLDRLLGLQVQPLRPFLLGLARHARELAGSLGKELEVAVDAGHSQLDRRIMDALRESFLHLVRNAVDHGIEPPDVREAAGKPRRGSLTLEARTERDRVVLSVRDDGAGVDRAALEERAREMGAEAAPTDGGELMSLLSVPGLSTRSEASAISGRGVGIDAVSAAVRRVGGDLRVESAPGAGTRFAVELPVARRGERVVTVRVGEWLLALPAAAVRGYRRSAGDGARRGDGDEDRGGRVREVAETVLGEILGARGGGGDSVAVDCRVAGIRSSVVADAVIGEEEVFVRRVPAGAGLSWPFEGVALLASGRPVPVVSVHDLLTGHGRPSSPPATSVAAEVVRVLLVDDSRVTREMLRRLLADGGVAVTAVGSAAEALDRLREAHFDCLVTDIEMPAMDGLELTRRLRASEGFADLPVVVVSTRDRPADRLAGLDAGADAYLTKRGLDARELVAVVRRLGARR